MKKLFISYGNSLYTQSLKRIRQEVEATNRFDAVRTFTDGDIPDFIKSYPLYHLSRGGGYWIWKPFVILEALKSLECDSDIVVYCDSGCRIYDDKEWDKGFGIMASYNAILFNNGAVIKNWTRKKMLDAYKDKLPYVRDMYQIQSTMLILNKRAMTLIQTWMDIMLNHPEFVRDVTSEEMKDEDKCFVENRHDQTALTFAGYLCAESMNIKFLWQNIESRHRDGQAVFAARISDYGVRSREDFFEPIYVSIAKKIIIYPYRNTRNYVFHFLNEHLSDSIRYVYPKLAAEYDFGFIRVGGCGLANCLYTYANAASIAHKTGVKMISPTWFNLSYGTYKRHQADKRHYLGLISSEGEISGLRRYFLLLFGRKRIQTVSGWGGYFRDFIEDAEYVSQYVIDHIQPKHKQPVDNFDFSDCVAVHVRLGDYDEDQRLPLSWYVEKVQKLREKGFEKFLLFSDGRDYELQQLMQMEGVQRVFFGSAISDIYAISKCCYLIGSDSTFSGWGAFLGQVPCCFKRKHFGPVLVDQSQETVEEQ